MRVQRWLVALGFAVVTLAACGGGDDGQDPAVTAETRAADVVRAKRASLRPADLPRGWTRDTSATPRGRCRAYLSGLTRTANVQTSFTSNADEADSEVGVFATADDARTAFARLGAGPMRTCLKRELEGRMNGLAEVKSGKADVGEISVESLPSSTYGDEATAIRVLVPLTQGTGRIELHSDLVVVRRDRGLLIATLATQNGDFDRDLKASLLGALSGRLGADA